MQTDDVLYDSAKRFASSSMATAMRVIDEAFEAGYAKAHPELIGAYVQAVAAHFAAAHVANEVTARFDALDDTLARLADAVERIADK